MNILCIGDVIGKIGCEFVRERLPVIKRNMGIDLVICNGENSADGNGITPSSMEHLYNSGVDVITTGNHAFRRKEMYDYFDSEEFLLRPANYPNTTPGKGICVVDKGRVQVAVINIMGTAYMESLACPFETAEDLLKQTNSAKIVIVDFHAEATGEKKALGYYLDGKISAIFGTHTHIQTADECILPQGTGYITDAGMTGPIDSVLGVKSELIIEKMKTKMPVRFEIAQGECYMLGIIFTIDEKTGKTTSIERIDIR